MKEFVEKLISRLEEFYDERGVWYDEGRDYHATVLKIVNQLAEEYSVTGGWIPCSERLPEEEGYYLITMKYYHLHNPIVMGCNFENGEWWNVDKDDAVIAWRELPESFKGE